MGGRQVTDEELESSRLHLEQERERYSAEKERVPERVSLGEQSQGDGSDVRNKPAPTGIWSKGGGL